MYSFILLFIFTIRWCLNRLGAGPRYVHRKTLLEVLAGELQTDSIRFSSHIDAIETESLEGSTIPIVHLSDGTIIKSKVINYNYDEFTVTVM